MAEITPIRKEVATQTEPVNLGDRAIDNLRFIRETMERSTHFTAVPGYGGMLMGITAVGAAYIAHTQNYQRDRVVTWIAEAFLAFAIGLLAMWQKSKLGGTPLITVPAKKFAMSFLPPLIVGVALTLGLWRYEYYDMMAPVWMLCYGAAVVCGGAFSVPVVPVMGWCFMAFGSIAFALPAIYGNYLLGVSFGLMHIIFGIIIGRRHGG